MTGVAASMWTRRAALGLAGAAAACAHMQAAHPAKAAMESALQGLIDANRIPGAVVLIARRERVIAQSLLGYADVAARTPVSADAIFRYYSMSKPITSAAVMALAEQGALRIDQPAQAFLPEFGDMRVYAGGGLEDMRTEPLARPITIADLLTHTSGVTYHFTGDTPVHAYYRANGVMRDTPVGRLPSDGPPAPDLDTLVARIGQAPLLHQPGPPFSYSYSTTVLGAVIERATGKRLDAALRELIFDPLGMKNAGFFVEDDALGRFVTNYLLTPDGMVAIETPQSSDYRDHARLLDGGGAIAGTADDYFLFARMIAGGGAANGARIMSAESIAAMLAPRVQVDGMSAAPFWFSYGLQIGDAASEASAQLPTGAVGWSGSGNTYFWVRPDSGDIVVFMTQVITPPGLYETALELRRIVNAAALELLSA